MHGSGVNALISHAGSGRCGVALIRWTHSDYSWSSHGSYARKDQAEYVGQLMVRALQDCLSSRIEITHDVVEMVHARAEQALRWWA